MQYTSFLDYSKWGTVERRFKHFDWLHERLTQKFTFLVLPPLPEKVLVGSTEEKFVEKRRKSLERYINRIARHPVVRGTEVLHHFLTVSSESKDQWKNGKRQAEKDKYVGGKLYYCVSLEAGPPADQFLLLFPLDPEYALTIFLNQIVGWPQWKNLESLLGQCKGM